MTFNECTPKSVMADFMASKAARGVEIPENLILNGTTNDILSFVKRSQIEAGSILDGAPASLQKVQNERIGNYWRSVAQDIDPRVASDFYQTEDGKALSQSTITSWGHLFMSPSQIIGEDMVS